MATAQVQSRSKKMAKDFLIYSIGVIGSKLMTFLLLPLYTHYIQPDAYGYYDLCLSACLLLMPIVTIQLRDGAFRFLLETQDKEERSRIVTFINKTLIGTTLITLLIALAVYFINPYKYLGYTTLLLIVMCFYEVYTQTVRGLGNNRSFIAVGLTASFGIAILSIVFVVIFNMGVPGIFLANILARIFALIVVDLHEKALSKYFDFRLTAFKGVGRQILKFSLPLLPTALCWWFISFSNRWFINQYMGEYEIGIYGIAARLAIVVQSIAMIFYQTWQENAIQQYNSPDRVKFFSKVFNVYVYTFVLITIVYTFGAKIVFPHIFSKSYIDSLNYIYPLCVATMLFALSSYFEIIYQCEKKTNRLLPPVLMAPIMNVVLNYVLIKSMGINGVIISYALVYVMIIIYRWIDVRKYIHLRLQPNFIVPVLVSVIGAIPFIYNTNILVDMLIACVSVVSLCLFSKDLRENVINKILNKFAKRAAK